MLERRRHGPEETLPDPADEGDSADRSPASAPISHAHARRLAWIWEDSLRPDFPVTVLARTGAIRRDTAPRLERDLAALEAASGPGMTIVRRQLWSLLDYVQRHGLRDEVEGWGDLRDDGELLEQTMAFAPTRQAQQRHTEDCSADTGDLPLRG